MLISDENRWCLDASDGIAHYWHELGLDHQFLLRRHFCVGSVMCWEAISSEGLFDLVWIDGSSKAENYQNLLKKYLVPIMDSTYIFQQDRAPAHITELTMKFPRRNGVQL